MRHDQQEATDTTGQGYPEESQPGTGIDARDHAEDDVTPDGDPPQTSAPQGRRSEPGDGQSERRRRLKTQQPRAIRLFDIN